MTTDERPDDGTEESTPKPREAKLERLKAALEAGLSALIRQHIAEIDQRFAITEQVLVKTFTNWKPDDIPGDLRQILRDVRIHRDDCVDQLTYTVTEDFREAMRVVERLAQTTSARTPNARPVQAQSKSQRSPTPAKRVAKTRTPAVTPPKRMRREPLRTPPSGLTSEEQDAVLRWVAKRRKARTIELREALKLTGKPVPLKRFLAWAVKTGLLTIVGIKRGAVYHATEALTGQTRRKGSR